MEQNQTVLDKTEDSALDWAWGKRRDTPAVPGGDRREHGPVVGN